MSNSTISLHDVCQVSVFSIVSCMGSTQVQHIEFLTKDGSRIEIAIFADKPEAFLPPTPQDE